MGAGDLSSVMRFTHDCSFCGRSQGGISPLRRRPKGFAIALWKPSPPAGGDSLKVAAALSAAVTTTKPIGERTPLSGGTNYVEVTTSNASCSSGEGVWGRGASLREAASPPGSP